MERDGYGFSDTADTPRDIDTVLEETKEALTLAGESGPYILFPHSLSGIEAIYWGQKYPSEVKGIIGLRIWWMRQDTLMRMPQKWIPWKSRFKFRYFIIYPTVLRL